MEGALVMAYSTRDILGDSLVRSDLSAALDLARWARLPPERAAELGVYYDRHSERTVHQLADLVETLALRFLHILPAPPPVEDEPRRECRPRQQGQTPPREIREARQGKQIDRLVTLLSREPLTADALADLFGVSEATATRMVSRARRLGHRIAAEREMGARCMVYRLELEVES